MDTESNLIWEAYNEGKKAWPDQPRVLSERDPDVKRYVQLFRSQGATRTTTETVFWGQYGQGVRINGQWKLGKRWDSGITIVVLLRPDGQRNDGDTTVSFVWPNAVGKTDKRSSYKGKTALHMMDDPDRLIQHWKEVKNDFDQAAEITKRAIERIKSFK